MDNSDLLIIVGLGLILVALAREVPHPMGSRVVNALGLVAGLVVLIAVLVR